VAPDVVAGLRVSKYLALTLNDVARSVKVVQAKISNAERAKQIGERGARMLVRVGDRRAEICTIRIKYY
jgi:hypothetical protein